VTTLAGILLIKRISTDRRRKREAPATLYTPTALEGDSSCTIDTPAPPPPCPTFPPGLATGVTTLAGILLMAVVEHVGTKWISADRRRKREAAAAAVVAAAQEGRALPSSRARWGG
jgi:hypothetical protein